MWALTYFRELLLGDCLLPKRKVSTSVWIVNKSNALLSVSKNIKKAWHMTTKLSRILVKEWFSLTQVHLYAVEYPVSTATFGLPYCTVHPEKKKWRFLFADVIFPSGRAHFCLWHRPCRYIFCLLQQLVYFGSLCLKWLMIWAVIQSAVPVIVLWGSLQWKY